MKKRDYQNQLRIGVLAKWVVLGRVSPGRRRLTAGLYFRHLYVHQLLQTCYLAFVQPWYKVSFPLYLWLKLLGAKVSLRCILSPVRDNVTTNADLIDIRDGCYLGNQPGIWSFEVHDDTSEGGGIDVTFHRTVLGKDSFLGPNSMLFGGACLEDGSAVGAMANVVDGRTVRAGTAHVGFNKRSPYAPRHAPGHDVGANSSLAFHIRGTMLAVYLIVLQIGIATGMLFVVVTVLQQLATVGPIKTYLDDDDAAAAAPEDMGRAFWLGAAGWVVLTALLRPFVAIAWALLYVAHKWMFMGAVKAGVVRPLRCGFHNRWIFLLNMYQVVAGVLAQASIRQSSFLSTINRMLGAKIGRNVKFDSVLFPEADLYEIGDNCWIGLYGIYCHDFFQRHLVFKPVICERGCRIDTGQVVPGTHLGPGTRVGPASLCLPGHYPGPCDSLQGLPATYVRRGGNGEWIPEDDDTIQEMAAPWLRRDEGALGRDGLAALLRRGPRVERLQIPRRGGGRKGKRKYGKNKELARPLLAGNEATDAMHDFV